MTSRDGAEVLAGVGADELHRLHKEIRDLRGQLRTRPLVARALGMLQERYGLADEATAYELLREASQRHNLKIRALASALLAAPPPSRSAELWFPGRIRHTPPEMSFLERPEQGQSAFLNVLLDVVLSCMGTTVGYVQLVAEGVLRLERHRGLTAELVDLLADVDGEDSSCGAALRRRARVTVQDVATDPIYAGGPAAALLAAAGTAAVQSTPLVAPTGQVTGMASTHHDVAGRVPTAGEASELDRIAGEAGRWLHWHQRTVVLDALEHLHQHAR